MISLVLALLSLVVLGLWMAGLLGHVRDGARARAQGALMGMGFRIERVDVIGEGRLDERAVRRAVGARPDDFFFALDLHAAQTRVEGLPWVERAVVRRLWPDRLVVEIVEKRPFALWQSRGELHIIDARGEVIGGRAAVEAYAGAARLRLFVGEGAREDASDMSRRLAAVPDIARRTRAVVQVGGRYDLELLGGVRVSLPEEGVGAALAQLSALHGRTRVLDREVAVIDLRLADRIGILAADGARGAAF